MVWEEAGWSFRGIRLRVLLALIKMITCLPYRIVNNLHGAIKKRLPTCSLQPKYPSAKHFRSILNMCVSASAGEIYSLRPYRYTI